MSKKNQTFNQLVIGGCSVTLLVALLALLVSLYLLVDGNRKEAQYPGSLRISSHSNYRGLPFEYRWDDSYLTADNFTDVYNWYSITFDLGSEARATERCILLEGINAALVISRHISVFMCNTRGGQMIYFTQSTWLTSRSTLLAGARDLVSSFIKPHP